jgi:hypothetical protein
MFGWRDLLKRLRGIMSESEPDKDATQFDKDVTQFDKDVTQLDKDVAQLRKNVTKPDKDVSKPEKDATTPDKPKDEGLKAIGDQELSDCKKVLREKRRSLLILENLLWRRTVEVQTYRNDIDKVYFEMYQAEAVKQFKKKARSRLMSIFVLWVVFIGAFVIVNYVVGISATISLPLIVYLLIFFWGVAILIGIVWASQSDLWKEGQSGEAAQKARDEKQVYLDRIEMSVHEKMDQINEFLKEQEDKYSNQKTQN